MNKLTKSLIVSAIAPLLLASGAASAVTNTYTITDPQEIAAFGHGYDVAKIVFTLDANDQLTVEIFPYGVPGDADGDGTTGDGNPNDTIADYPGVGAGEVINIGMICAYDGTTCTPNFNVAYTNNTLYTIPAVSGVTFDVLADRYLLTIPSVTSLKQAVLGYVPTTTTFGAFSFTFSVLDQNLDDHVPDGANTCERVELVPPVVIAPGTGTIGYWKNHPSDWPANCDLTLPGSGTDPNIFAMNILDAPVRGDKTVSLAKQLVGAKLNVCAGNDSSCIAATIDDAEAWLTSYPIFSGQKSWLGADVYQELLDDYNNGKLCAPHRD